jgi:diguanylate cyclase (GGDEF)-like protein
MRDLKEEEELKAQRLLARTDDLTSLRNRRGFDEEAGLLVRLARRQNSSITVGYLDLTRFKALNDTRGHVEGDRALLGIARALTESVRSTDVVARIGGDEFAIVLPATGAVGARNFFEALKQRLLVAIRAGGWDIGFGVGVVTFVGHVPDLSEALSKADHAMYRAKGIGGSATVYGCFGPGQDSA